MHKEVVLSTCCHHKQLKPYTCKDLGTFGAMALGAEVCKDPDRIKEHAEQTIKVVRTPRGEQAA